MAKLNDSFTGQVQYILQYENMQSYKLFFSETSTRFCRDIIQSCKSVALLVTAAFYVSCNKDIKHVLNFLNCGVDYGTHLILNMENGDGNVLCILEVLLNKG